MAFKIYGERKGMLINLPEKLLDDFRAFCKLKDVTLNYQIEMLIRCILYNDIQEKDNGIIQHK